MAEEQKVNLTVEETATRLRVSVSTMNRWRCQGSGPKFIRAGGRILYNVDDVAAFERGNVRSSTR